MTNVGRSFPASDRPRTEVLMPETPDGGWILDCGVDIPDFDAIARELVARWQASQRGDWWEVRDGAVHLTRLPREGEKLPSICAAPPRLDRVGGGWILPVRAPAGELLSYGRATE
jgi:hypothetical protein